MDALKNWDKIVELVEESTVVFNMIDVGEYWDLAISSLCMKKGKLTINGGTFCHQMSVEIFRPKSNDGCSYCQGLGTIHDEIIQKLLPSKIESYTNLEFLPRDRNPVA